MMADFCHNETIVMMILSVYHMKAENGILLTNDFDLNLTKLQVALSIYKSIRSTL
jgi:hypothetical protein